jgi:hypothetical protein
MRPDAVMTFCEHAPEVRGHVIAGRRELREALATCPDPAGEIHEATATFEAAMTAWRKAHHELIMRWLRALDGAGAENVAHDTPRFHDTAQRAARQAA